MGTLAYLNFFFLFENSLNIIGVKDDDYDDVDEKIPSALFPIYLLLPVILVQSKETYFPLCPLHTPVVFFFFSSFFSGLNLHVAHTSILLVHTYRMELIPFKTEPLQVKTSPFSTRHNLLMSIGNPNCSVPGNLKSGGKTSGGG